MSCRHNKDPFYQLSAKNIISSFTEICEFMASYCMSLHKNYRWHMITFVTWNSEDGVCRKRNDCFRSVIRCEQWLVNVLSHGLMGLVWGVLEIRCTLRSSGLSYPMLSLQTSRHWSRHTHTHQYPDIRVRGQESNKYRWDTYYRYLGRSFSTTCKKKEVNI